MKIDRIDNYISGCRNNCTITCIGNCSRDCSNSCYGKNQNTTKNKVNECKSFQDVLNEKCKK